MNLLDNDLSIKTSKLNPTISVVMPLYNEERYIEVCLDSLLVQTYPQDRMEWILVDGDSSDKTLEILERYRMKYPELITLANNPDRTVPYAMNKGYWACNGGIPDPSRCSH